MERARVRGAKCTLRAVRMLAFETERTMGRVCPGGKLLRSDSVMTGNFGAQSGRVKTTVRARHDGVVTSNVRRRENGKGIELLKNENRRQKRIKEKSTG